MYAPINRKIGSLALGSTPCELNAEGSKVAATVAVAPGGNIIGLMQNP